MQSDISSSCPRSEAESDPPPPYSAILPFLDSSSTLAPVQRRLMPVAERPLSICTSSAPETAPISTTSATSFQASQYTILDHEDHHPKPASSQAELESNADPGGQGSSRNQILDSTSVTPIPQVQAAESDSGMTVESSREWHGLGQSFHTHLAAVNQFGRSFGVPFEPAAPGSLAEDPAEMSISSASLDTAAQTELLRSIFPRPIRGGVPWQKTALVICSAQHAALANLSMNPRAIAAVEQRIRDILAAWRNLEVVTEVARGPIIHMHTICGHGSSSSDPSSNEIRRQLDPAPDVQSFGAASRGAQPLAWAQPPDGEYTFYKSTNSIFGNGVAVNRVLQWEGCDSILLAGFDTPGIVFEVSGEGDEQATYTFRSGNDLQLSQHAAIRLRFQCGIISRAYACDVSEVRTRPLRIPS
ncbi:hypothetical protein OC845_005862 [Tilletia horrida]|nr:hypothetical protein OC845_005862 [Tilletia horrida]